MVAPACQAAGSKGWALTLCGTHGCLALASQRVQPAFLLVSLNPQHAGQSVLCFSCLVEVEELQTVEGSPVLGLQWAVPRYSLGNTHPGCFLICEAELVVPLCKVIIRIAEFY